MRYISHILTDLLMIPFPLICDTLNEKYRFAPLGSWCGVADPAQECLKLKSDRMHLQHLPQGPVVTET